MKRIIGIILVSVLVLGALPVRAAAAEIPAKSAVLMDVATGTVLFQQNPHEKLAPASVTKVMTMLLIMEAIESRRIRWEDTVTASSNAAAKGGSQVYLKEGESMTVTDMLKAIAVSSANDCACAMAEHLAGSEEAFVGMMNRRAAELGMADTHFVNCTGLDDSPEAAQHRTSAYDIALMSRQLLKFHPEIKKFTTIWMDTLRDGTFGLSNTNKLVRFYSGATGLKTGFTSGAGYCLSASAQRDGMELIAVVMGSSTSKDRFNGCKMLLDRGFANWAVVEPALQGELTVPVTLGKETQVEAVLGTADAILLEKGLKGSVTTDIELEASVAAPVSTGQRLGTMTVRAGEQVLAKLPLVAKAPVEKLGYWDIVVMLVKKVAMVKEKWVLWN